MRLGLDAAGASADEEWGSAVRVATVTAAWAESFVTAARLIDVLARAVGEILVLPLLATPLKTITSFLTSFTIPCATLELTHNSMTTKFKEMVMMTAMM